jgi:uncharacterized NAD(P)/FAD-binding protein YdhS
MNVAYSGNWSVAESEPAARPRSIVIIGGGASGVLMAAHLLRGGNPDLDVTIVEKRPSLGRGLAYSTSVPDHLLNARASNMSAFADDPEHFVRWIKANGIEAEDASTHFAPRRLYGEYLEELLRSSTGEGSASRVRIVAGSCVRIDHEDGRTLVRMADGQTLAAEHCILATGHDERPCRATGAQSTDATGRGPQDSLSDPVLIIGTGLSMVDTCISLLLQGHTGPILTLSRRGLLPAVHTKTAPVKFAEIDIPFGASPPVFMRWFRSVVRDTEAEGGNWRDVVDGLRPFNQRIWRSWSQECRRAFFRHLKAWWDIHRHRMAPQIHELMARAIADGQLQVIAGRLLETETTAEGFRVSVQQRASKQVQDIRVARVYDCAGVIADPAQSSNPLIQSLLASGMARCDHLHIGIDVTLAGEIIRSDGSINRGLYAIGPLTRGTFLEIEAVPDIRVQCQTLSAALVSQIA